MRDQMSALTEWSMKAVMLLMRDQMSALTEWGMKAVMFADVRSDVCLD